MDVYGDQLERIVSSLIRKAIPASVRGEGNARFAYADASGRAVEVSRDDTGFFVELFEEPAVEDSVFQLEQQTLEDATRLAVEWLSRVETLSRRAIPDHGPQNR